MITQIAAIMTAQIPPDKTPSTSPNHDLATIPPVMPATAITAATPQYVPVPAEHKMATNNVKSSIDRRLNWYQGNLGSGAVMVSVV